MLSVAAILPFFMSSVFLSFIIGYQDLINLFTVREWLLFYLAASFCMALAFTHTTFIALLSGYFLGWSSVLFVIFSYLLALATGYFLGRKLDKGKLLSTITSIPKARAIAEDLKSNELKIIVLSRLSPVLPFALMNLFLAFLDADLKKYMAGGFAGMLPRTLLFIWTGSEARNLVDALKNGTDNHYSTILVAFLLIISLFGLFYYIAKATRKAKQASKD